MGFVDLYPFDRSEHPDETHDVRAQGEAVDFAGRRVVYRLGYQSMEVEGLPDEIEVGPVTIRQVVGPVRTQRTDVVQQAGIPLIFDKVMHIGIEVGDGIPMSVCEREDVFPATLSDQFRVWRDEALMALGVLAATLDERIAQSFVFEDVVVFDAEGKEPQSGVDIQRQIRNFLPYPVAGEVLSQVNTLGSIDVEGPLLAATRWYLTAVQGGVRADAIVYFWIAVEALLGPGEGTAPTRLANALEDIGVPPDAFPLTTGRLYWIRGEVVHKDKEQPDDLVQGYGILECIVRLLLHDRLDLSGTWPPSPRDREGFSPEVRPEIDEAWDNPPAVNLDFRIQP